MRTSATSRSPNVTPLCKRTKSSCSFCRNTSARCSDGVRSGKTPINFNCCCRKTLERDIRAANENEPDATGKAAASTGVARRQPRRNRGRLPLHLPRFDVVIDVENETCPCCGGGLHKIGETVKEMLDIVPLQYRVKRIIRPRYGCRACASAVVQAPAPAQPIDGGMATEALLADRQPN